MAKHALFCKNMWYVIQTQTGKEQEFIEIINKAVEHRTFKRCFFVKRERVWRKNGKCITYTEPLYPGYIFVETVFPEEFYSQLFQIPQFSMFIGKNDNKLNPVQKEEMEFLQSLILGDREDTIRLSPIEVNEAGEIISCQGPLRRYENCIVKQRLRMRYVVVKTMVGGREEEILLGVKV